MLCDYENLVYACNRCNSVKRDQILLDPCTATLADHIRVEADGGIQGLTPEGQELVLVLGLDRNGPRSVQQRCLRVLLLYQTHPSNPEVRALYLDFFGFPDDLPDLTTLRPEHNTRPDGMRDSYLCQRAEGRLPEVYF